MRASLLSATLVGLAALPGGLARAQSGLKPPAERAFRVAVLSKPGCNVYETVIDEFRGRLRATIRVVQVTDDVQPALKSWLARYRPDLIFAVGQTAYDAVRGERSIPLMHALVYHRLSVQHEAVPGWVTPEAVLTSLRALEPGLKVVGAVHGRQTERHMVHARIAAGMLGIQLVDIGGSSPAEVISSLRRLAPRVQAIWLLPDLQILTRQVVQYALGLQLRRRIPLMGAVRRHVEQGALCSMDYDARSVGRQAARIAGARLAGERLRQPHEMVPILTVNRTTARSIGLDPRRIEALADEVVP